MDATAFEPATFGGVPAGWTEWGIFITTLSLFRCSVVMFMRALGRSEAAERTRITRRPKIDEKQLKRESVWPMGFFIDWLVLVALWAVDLFGVVRVMPLWNPKGVFWHLLFHVTVIEFIYYWLHRILHWPWLYRQYHAYHHASINTEPTTSYSFYLGERLSYTTLFAATPIFAMWLGVESWIALAIHLVWFDFNNSMGHINFEMAPRWFHESPLAYWWYTPSYHSIHHTRFIKNYSLFMPWPDMLFGTADWGLTNNVFWAAYDGAIGERETFEDVMYFKRRHTPGGKDFAFIVHPPTPIDYVTSSRIVSNRWIDVQARLVDPMGEWIIKPWFYWLTYPIAISSFFFIRYFSAQGFHVEEDFEWQPKDRRLPPLQGSTYVLSAVGVDYLMPSRYQLINRHICRAILMAQSMGTRVCGLAALNKAEWLNHGGSDLIKMLGNHLNGTTSIVHGDTMTAACVLHSILRMRKRGRWSRNVFFIGATSKVGRAVVLKMAELGIAVKMFTQAEDRFLHIQGEAGSNGKFLTQATRLADGADCDLWVLGKSQPAGRKLLDRVPTGALLMNFAVPDPLHFSRAALAARKDVDHMDAGVMHYNPQNTTAGFHMLLPMGDLYACLAGCITHSFMNLKEHEIGAVDVSKMDPLWEKATEIGFELPPNPTSFMAPIQSWRVTTPSLHV